MSIKAGDIITIEGVPGAHVCDPVPPFARRGEVRMKRTVKKPRVGTLFGRTRSLRKENVAVYCDGEGETRVDVWTIYERRGSIRMSLSAARVLRKALNDYLSTAVALLVLACTSIAHAQPAPPPVLPSVSLEPAEVDTLACRYNSWTLTAAGIDCANDAACSAAPLPSGGECAPAGKCVWVRLIPPAAKADASPGAMVVDGPTREGNTVSITVKPNQGCAAHGCRNGNNYQFTLQPLGELHGSVNDAPTCNFAASIRKVVP